MVKEDLKIDSGTGYLYFLDKHCPLATGNSYRVYYHRYVMSVHLGRWLTTEEVVHHKDENKLNNLIDNLELLTSSEHAKLHAIVLDNKICENCNKSYKPKKFSQKFCTVACANINSRKNSEHITADLIEYWVKNYSWTRASKELGMSDNGLRKKYRMLTGLDPKYIK